MLDEATFRVGVIGHRVLRPATLAAFVYDSAYRALTVMRAMHHNGIRVLSAVAEGADTLFCEAALAQSVPFDVILPFRGYSNDFVSPEASARYRRLETRAHTATAIRFDDRSPDAYRKAMQWIVFQSDFIVVIWDGQEVGSDGGTWQALQLTRSMEKPFLHIDVSARTFSVTSNNTRGYMRRDIRSMEDIADVLV